MAKELIRPGSVVWDIGANVGLFSFSAAVLAGTSGFVLSIEPDVWLAQLLTRSAHRVRNGSPNTSQVAILAAAVSETNRIGELNIATRARASNHLVEVPGSSQTGGDRCRQYTVTISLDFLLEYFPPPSVLKIDVEGAETKVLRGASRLLQTARPTIWCEVSSENSESAAQLLHQAGYQLYAAALHPEKRTPLIRASWDTLAIPSPL
jgi:FkbM family methyltransferase